jgi:hypothetical protein
MRRKKDLGDSRISCGEYPSICWVAWFRNSNSRLRLMMKMMTGRFWTSRKRCSWVSLMRRCRVDWARQLRRLFMNTSMLTMGLVT